MKGNNIYKCEICGNVIEMLHDAEVNPDCCGQEMKKLDEKTNDAGKEKHVPVIEKTGKGIKVKVGSIEHPMSAEHFIMWIEVISGGKSYKQFLNPGEKPEAEFCLDLEKVEKIRAYCNIHGLWIAGS